MVHGPGFWAKDPETPGGFGRFVLPCRKPLALAEPGIVTTMQELVTCNALRLEVGDLLIEVWRDERSTARNNFQLFVEEWEGVAYLGLSPFVAIAP